MAPLRPIHRLFAAAAQFRQQHAGLLRAVHKDRARSKTVLGPPMSLWSTIAGIFPLGETARKCGACCSPEPIGDAHLVEHYRRLRPVRRRPSEQLNHRDTFLVLPCRIADVDASMIPHFAATPRAPQLTTGARPNAWTSWLHAGHHEPLRRAQLALSPHERPPQACSRFCSCPVFRHPRGCHRARGILGSGSSRRG